MVLSLHAILFLILCLKYLNYITFILPSEKLQNISIWETSAFTEHGDKKTDYLRILRVVFLRFLKPTEQESLTYKLTTRIFTPRPLKSTEGARDNKDDAAISERSFEDLQTVEGRVNSWLIRSGEFKSCELVNYVNTSDALIQKVKCTCDSCIIVAFCCIKTN